MASHNGWGATRGGGRLPRPRAGLEIPRVNPMLALMAKEAREGAGALGMPVRDFLQRARADGIADYDDETLEQIAMIASM